MAQTYVYKNGTGDVATTFPFTFPYLKEADVKVSVLESGVWNVKTKDTHYEFDTATTLKFKSGQVPASGTNNIKIYRSTDADKLTATFYPGSAIRSADLNDNFTQNLYSTEESKEASEAAFQSDGSTAMKSNIVFDGATDTNDHQTTLTVTDPTQDNTITLPDRTGTVITTGDTGTVTSTMITDGTIVNADINASAAIAQSKLNIANATTSAAGYASAADKTKLDGIETAATADQTAAEIRTLVESASDSNVFTDADHTKLNGIETAATADQTNAEIRTAVEAASDSNVFTDADHSKLDGIAASANNYSISSDLLDEDNFASDSATKPPSQQSTKAYIAATSEPKSARLTQLAGMPSATASILIGSPDLTSTTTKLNLLADKSVVTTVDGNSTNVQLPTAKAVNDQIISVINDVGGFTPIADHEKFPTSNPDPGDDAGTIVSIADAGGLKVADGSGSGDYAGTAGNSIGAKTTGDTAVTITGIDSTLRGTTIAAGKGMLVQTTSTEHTYTYHRLVVDEAGVANAQTLVSDFNQRYRSGTKTADNHSSNDDGDLFFDTSANKMFVYDGAYDAGGSWKQVTSAGDFKYLFLCPAGGTGAPTLDGSIATYDLREGSNSGSAATVTSAAQLMVSINGVVQKANTGTSAPAEGFALVDANTIIFGANLASGDSVFIIQFGSALTINEPGDNTVATTKIQNGAVNGDKLANNLVLGSTLTVGEDDTGYDVKFFGATSGEYCLWDESKGELKLPDFVELTIGSDDDLRMYHNAAGNWILHDDKASYRATEFYFQEQNDSNKTWIHCVPAGSVDLYYDDAKKFETTTDGVTVTGNVDLTGSIVFEGATADAHETTIAVTDPTADRTITLPNATGTVPVLAVTSNTQITSTPEELNYVDGVTSAIQTQLDAKAPLASPAFTGLLKEEVEIDTTNKLSAATDIDLADGMIHYFTTTESTTSTPNLRWDSSNTLNSKVSTGEALSVTIITTAAAGAFSAALNIDGTASGVTTNWVGGSAPDAGGSSGVDIHAYTIIKTGDAAYTVIANHSTTS